MEGRYGGEEEGREGKEHIQAREQGKGSQEIMDRKCKGGELSEMIIEEKEGGEIWRRGRREGGRERSSCMREGMSLLR